jgi:hypothetical protein
MALQHEAVAAECHNDVGVIRIDPVIAASKLRRRLFC